MRTRLIAPLAVLFLVLAGAATAAAATGLFEKNDSGVDSPRDLAERGAGVTTPTGATTPTTPSISLPETSLPQTTLPDDGADPLALGETQTFAASNAGSVTIRRDGGTLTVISANANAGFVGEVERGTGTEVEVQFANGSVRVDFNAELEDGAVRVRVRVSGVAVDNPGTTPATTPTSTSTTPANDDNVDNSGPGNAHEGDDNSGPGNSHDGGDDNSGSGHSGSDH